MSRGAERRRPAGMRPKRPRSLAEWFAFAAVLAFSGAAAAQFLPIGLRPQLSSGPFVLSSGALYVDSISNTTGYLSANNTVLGQ